MKILYLSHRIPYPPNKGDKIRSFNEIKCLSNSHEIHLACLADDPADLKHEDHLKKYCKKVCVIRHKPVIAKIKSLGFLILKRPISVGYFYSRLLQRIVNQWLSSNAYDAIICFSSPMAEYIFNKSTSRLKDRSTKLIMDFCDVDSDKWLQYSQQSRFPLSLIYKMENNLLLKYERKVNRLFDHSVFVSQYEADLFLRLFCGAENVTVISNGVDHEYFSPDGTHSLEAVKPRDKFSSLEIQKLFHGDDKPKKPNKQANPATRNSQPIMLFTGTMDYYANVDSVIWFCNDIFPIIKKDFPESQFYIVGSNPDSKVTNLAREAGVVVTGHVKDTRPYYQAADICVIPIRMARGIQNKVLEAMAMGKPVVATTKAIEGVEAVPDEHVLIEDTPKGFAKIVSILLKDRQLRERLGSSGRDFVKEKFDWSTNMKELEALFQNRSAQ